MNKHLPIWCLGQISEELCALATKEFMELPSRDAYMGVTGAEHSHKNRNTTVRFADYTHWFGSILRRFGEQANTQCLWGYEITDHECVQFAEYQPGQHYDWHVDNFPLCGLPTDRKVTVICLLSDPQEFVGGELQVRLYSEYVAPLSKGTVIAFPSILEHRVIPVISGLRMSATMWLSGPRFR